MTTAAPPQPPAQVNHLERRRFVDLFQTGISAYTETVLGNGNTQVEGLRVFRSGTFRDSMGMQHTWDPEHITSMVGNFNMLRQKSILPNVPVRDGHRSFFGGGGSVIGYIGNLRTEEGTVETTGDTETFLIADFEFTDPNGLEKFHNGTFRARSAEVGMYEDNREALYYPVFMGFAFVDIPAVEGLYTQNVPQSVTLLEENPVTTPAPNSGVPSPGTGSTQPPAPAPQNQPPAQHQSQSPAPAPHQFSINGQPTTDFAAVQTHIDTLEAFRVATIEENRKQFCKALASSGRILASALDATEAKVLAMDETAFTAFKDVMESVQPSSVTQTMPVPSDNSGQHTGGSHPGSTGQGVDPKADRISVLEKTLDGLKKSGMKDDALKNSRPYKELQTLRNAA